MFDVNELLGMMNSGVSADEIASIFTDALNAAQKQKKIEEEQAAQALQKEKEKEKEQAEKLEDTSFLLETVRDYLAQYYPNIKIEGANTPEDFVALLDNIAQIQTTFSTVLKDVAERPRKNRKSKDPFEDLLHSFGF